MLAVVFKSMARRVLPLFPAGPICYPLFVWRPGGSWDQQEHKDLKSSFLWLGLWVACENSDLKLKEAKSDAVLTCILKKSRRLQAEMYPEAHMCHWPRLLSCASALLPLGDAFFL